ncbi:hypothetical protein FRB94_005480 [Tulasnella sp. JGI-2019a]|nr:hypothetical protein FRB94_005480 [Tulasnella sp. JGI-2019a]
MAIRRIFFPALVLALIVDYTSSYFAYAAHGQSFLSNNPSRSGVRQVLEHRPSTALSQCNMSGPIETTQCDYETLESVNDDLHHNLHKLVRTPFFKYLKIDLSRECPYWEANGYCVLRDCAVTTIDESDIPEAWRTACLSRLNRPPTDELRKTLPGCYYRDSDYCVLDDDESKDGEYVDLTLNPERFTGYSGPAAHRIWEAIYDENCFGISEADFHASIGKGENDLLTTSPFGITPVHVSPLVNQAHEVEKETCLEKRVFYRVVSGLHASISIHLCKHNLDQKTGTWAPNLQCFIDRIASNPERLQYVYFNAVILLRAIARAGPYLSAYDIYTGIDASGDADKATSQLMENVIRTAKNVGQFDETSLFRGEDAQVLKEEFKVHFRNITRIMDCVGCDKCRLWGKVQTSGLGTALKILFELDEKALDPTLNPNLLQRSEVVTLVNTLHQLSESLQSVDEFRRMWAGQEAVNLASKGTKVATPSPSTLAEVGSFASWCRQDDEKFLLKTISFPY